MPYYEVHYKTDADTKFRKWRLGECPTAKGAVVQFNQQFGQDVTSFRLLGDFDGPHGDYVLIEQKQTDSKLYEIAQYPLVEVSS